jgi:hypothetical protein
MELSGTLKPVRVIELGEGYASTSVNTGTFRHHGLVTRGDYQFTAFYVSDTEFVVARRDIRDGSVQKCSVKGKFSPDDVHNTVCLGLDPAGFLHMAYDHHASPLRYRRSLRPLDIETWTDDLPMTGKLENKVTYPFFVQWPADARDREGRGRLMFLYRHWGSGQGDVCLKEYDHRTGTWTDVAERFVKGMDQVPWTSNAYWNHPAFDSHGNTMLSWVWRVVQKASAKGDFIFNHNHGFAKSPDGRHWFTSHGIELSLPMTQVNSEIIWATPPGVTMANMTTSAADPRDRLHIAGYWSEWPGEPPQYTHLWFDGRRWRCDALTDRTTSFGLLTWDAPMSYPEIVIDPQDSVYFIYQCDLTGTRMVIQRLDPPDYRPPGKVSVLWDEELCHTDPLIDRVRWLRDGVLSMLIQWNFQPELLAKETVASRPVRIVEWEL